MTGIIRRRLARRLGRAQAIAAAVALAMAGAGATAIPASALNPSVAQVASSSVIAAQGPSDSLLFYYQPIGSQLWHHEEVAGSDTTYSDPSVAQVASSSVIAGRPVPQPLRLLPAGRREGVAPRTGGRRRYDVFHAVRGTVRQRGGDRGGRPVGQP